MRDRVNQLPPDADVSYRGRIAILRERKLEDTRDKKGIRSFADGDDYGAVAPPEGYRFRHIPNHENGSFYGYEGWSQNFFKLMSEHPVHIDPCDAFACRWMNCMAWMRSAAGIHVFNPDVSFDHLKPDIEKYGIVSGIGADAHFGGDYAIGLELGWGGLMEKLVRYREKNPEHRDFYDAEILTVMGVQTWIRNACFGIENALLRETNPVLIENLKAMLACNRYLVEGAPRTLREACQWICWFNMASREYNRDGAGCQLDEILRPYYERDRAVGLLTDDEARYYVACLLLNDPHYYQLGGLSPEGRDMVTPFSYLILEAADWLDSACNITIRVHEGMDREFLRKAVDYLFKNKNGWPRFSGDQALSEGFMRKGYPVELARQRVAVGCNWMSLPGLEYTLNDCVKLNCARVFRIALDEMMASGGEKTSEALWERYEHHMERAVRTTAEGILFHLDNQYRNEPELMLNLLSHGPVEKGLDMSHGGAEYYNMAIDGTGIATVADSFAAIRQRVELERRITMEELYEAVRTNYAGPRGEYIRLMLAASQRYGGGNTLGDRWAVRISESFTRQVCAMDALRPPVKFIPGWFSWSNTIQFGKAVGATPNGRRDGEPINHGANPHPGFRRDGALTAMTNSICAVQCGCGNTCPVQLELDPGLARGEESVQKICDYILTLFRKGGTLLNINIINAARILAANENPDLFPDLVVRVTGFTAYFCLLTPEFRKLVVDRILTAG